MKKAFNFRSALVIVLVLVMCLMAFVACDKDKDGQKDNDNGLSNAKEYVKALYINNSSKTAADYTVVSYVTIAGVKYTVNWSVEITTEGVDASAVKVVAGEESTTIDVIDIAEQDINYTLTATVHDANGNTESVSFKRMVPKFRVNTWAEYVAAKDDELIIADGVVTMYSSKTGGIFTQYGSTTNKGKYNTMYIQNADGAFYAYSMQKDPATIEGLAVGKTVRISGIKKNYQGTLELTEVAVKEILDDTIKTVEPVDITTLYTNAEDAKDTTITNLQGQLVTLKNVVILSGDTSTKYCYFTLNGVKSYVRPSTSTSAFPGDKINDFCEAFNTNKGHYATITGQVLTYNSAFYIQPLNENAVVFGEMATLTPAEEVQFVKENADALPDVTNNGATLTLPTQSDLFEGRVKISWTADNTEICNIENGVATFTYDDTKEGGKVKLTATYTHTDTSVEAVTDVFEVKLLAPKAITVADFLKQSTGNAVYILTGHVVAVNKVGKAGSFVLADETGAVFSYESGNVTLGEKVKVFARRAANNGTPQLYPISIQKVEGGEAYTYPEPETIDVETIKSTTFNASNIADYTGKYTKITGATLYKLGDYINAGLKEGTDYVKYVETYLNDTIKAAVADLIDTPVNIYGYVRGYGNGGKTLQVQVVSIEAKPLNDEEKVAKVKTELSDLTTNKDFDLPTSKIATITWALKSGTGATLEGNHVTITQTDADQTVVFTATIVSGEASDTKDITVTIKAKDNRVAGVKGVEGVAYKLVMNQTNANKVVYLLGSMSGFYIATTEKVEEGIDVYVEIVSENAYRLYTTIEGKKQYIEMIVSGTHLNAEFHETASMTWSWNDTLNTYTAVLDGKECVLGTRNDKTFTTVGACEVSKNPFVCQLYGQPAPEKSDAEKVAEAKAALDLETKTTGVSFTLPTTGINGTTITWTSNNEAVIAINGENAVVTAPAAETVVTLTATIKLNEATATKTFDVTVTVTIPEFNVTINQPADGGTLAVTINDEAFTGGKVQQGKTLVIVPTAVDANHELVAILVNDTKLDAVEGVYSVTVNDAEVTITATFREIKYATVTVGTVDNGTLDVKVGDVAVEADKQYRDGTVLTITATANPGYKLVAVKVNGEAITGNTYTIKETDTTVAITAEFALEYPVMTIAEFKNATKGTKGQVSGIVTVVDIKAVHIQDAAGNALYIYYGKNKVPADTFVAGKEYTFKGTKALFDGLDQMATPVVVGEGRDTETVINPTVLDEEAYKKLELKDSALLVTINGVKYTGGKWMLGETEIAHWEGSAAAANSAALNARVALLKEGVEFDLVGVNIAVNKNVLQVTLNSADQVVIDWVPSVSVDLKEIGIGKTAKITVVADPAVTTDVKATFVSENDAIATVDENGVITGVAAGSVAIKVTANGNTVSTETITVVATVETFVVTFTKEGTNGNITSVTVDGTELNSGDSVDKGKTITVTVAPAEGYQLASYTLNGGDAVAANGETSFDVTVTDDVTIVVTFELIPTGPETLTSANFAGKAKDEFVSVDGWTLNVAKGCYDAVGGVFHSSFRKDKESVTSNTFKAQNSVGVTFHWYLNNKSTNGSMSSKLKFEGLDASGKVVATYTSEELNGTTVQKPADMKVTLTGEGIVQVKITFVKSGGGNIGFSTITIATTVA